MNPAILVICGPTASGKSALALSIAENLAKQNKNAVIINADSQQLYRELRILTARPTPEEEARIPHRLYGTLPAAQACSAGEWLRLARMEIDWALAKGILPLVVGGTGLYLKALMEGISAMPELAPEIRQQAVNDYDAMGQAAFAARQAEIDPVWAARLKVLDRQRLIRAYEVWLGSGRPLSWWQAQAAQPPYPAEYFAMLQPPLVRAALYARCDARFAAMVEGGALEEVRQLLALGLPPELPAMKSVGVRELAAALRGDSSMAQAIALGQQATRQYAKRQLTWFRHQFKGIATARDWNGLFDTAT